MKSRITVAKLERVLLLQLFTILQSSCDRKVFRSLSLLNLSYSGVVSAQLRGGGGESLRVTLFFLYAKP